MDLNFKTKDSGQREDFPTGSRRDTQNGKLRFDLIGIEGLIRLAGLMARGAEKYGEGNWRKGQPATRYFASAFRHLMQWAMGMDDEDHLAAVAFNVFGIMHIEAEGMTDMLDHDRYKLKPMVSARDQQLMKQLCNEILYQLNMDDKKPRDWVCFAINCPDMLRGLGKDHWEAALLALVATGLIVETDREGYYTLTKG